jgi:hypothetical protein
MIVQPAGLHFESQTSAADTRPGNCAAAATRERHLKHLDRPGNERRLRSGQVEFPSTDEAVAEDRHHLAGRPVEALPPALQRLRVVQSQKLRSGSRTHPRSTGRFLNKMVATGLGGFLVNRCMVQVVESTEASLFTVNLMDETSARLDLGQLRRGVHGRLGQHAFRLVFR